MASAETMRWPAAEQATLAAMIDDPAFRLTVLAAGDDVWTHPASRRIAMAVRHLVDQGHPVDAASVEAVSGLPLRAHPQTDYWPMLLEQRLARRLAALGQWLLKPHEGASPTSVAALAWQKLQQAVSETHDVPVVSGADAVQAGLARVLQGPPQWLVAGIPGLDALTAWWGPGDLVILGARPSQGKTALGLQWATGIAATGRGVLFLSGEMAPEALGLRALSQLTGRSRDQVVRTAQDPAVGQAMAQLSAWPWQVLDASGATVGALQAAVARAETQYGRADVLIVDYLQLIAPAHRETSREQEVARIARDLKRWARRDHRLIVALAQLRRAVDERANRRPTLGDLRESGAIEQDADGVILIYHDLEDPGQAELICAKNRNGPTGMVPVTWDGPTMRFGPR